MKRLTVIPLATLIAFAPIGSSFAQQTQPDWVTQFEEQQAKADRELWLKMTAGERFFYAKSYTLGFGDGELSFSAKYTTISGHKLTAPQQALVQRMKMVTVSNDRRTTEDIVQIVNRAYIDGEHPKKDLHTLMFRALVCSTKGLALRTCITDLE